MNDSDGSPLRTDKVVEGVRSATFSALDNEGEMQNYFRNRSEQKLKSCRESKEPRLSTEKINFGDVFEVISIAVGFWGVSCSRNCSRT